MKPFSTDAKEYPEAKYKTIFDAINSAISIRDPETGTILEANRKTIELYGYTEDEILTLTAGDLSSGISPYTREAALKKAREAQRQGGLAFEWLYRHKSGRLFWAEVDLKPAMISGSRVIIAAAHEITKHKHSEERLRESEACLCTLADNIPQFALMADGTGRVFWYTRRWSDYAGITFEDMQVWGGREIHHPDHFKQVVDGIGRSFETGEPWEDTFPLRGKDGGYRWFFSRAIPIKDSEGRVVRWFGTSTDITDHKQMEELLRQSEERLRTLADALPQLVWTANPDGAVDYFNERHKDYQGIGRTPEGVFEWGAVLHEDDVEPTMDAWRRSLETGEVYQIEHRLRLADGTFQWHLSRGFPLWDAQRRIVKWFGTATNIEIVKRAEEKINRLNAELGQKVREHTRELAKTVTVLDQQREVLQTIFDNIPVMLDFYDKEGNNVLVNREFARLLGWSPEEIRSMDLLAAIYPDPDYRKEVVEYMQAAQPGWRDMEITTRSGDILPSSWTNVRLSDGSRIGIGIDISGQRKMEQNLRRLVKAIEQAGEGITIFGPEWVFEYVNPAYEDLSGYRRDELMGRNVSAFIDYFVDSQFEVVMGYVTRQKKEWRGRQKRVRKNGEIFDISLTVTPVYNERGEVVNFIEVVRDITGEVRMQEQLSQSQKLEAIGTLAGGVAHDLKNILTPIVINTEIALMDLDESHPVHELLQEIMQAAKMGTDLAKQIVTFSRKESQEKRPVAIEPVVREAVDFLKSALPSTIDIHQKLTSGGACVLADPTRIKQVMVNLGTNAGYAMKEKGGELDVKLIREDLGEEEAQKVSVDLSAGPYVRIIVRDTGAGMDDRTRQRIFEPFFTTKEHGEGTGMGLAVVHGIIREYGGAVTVWSKPGKGSTFSVWLPVLQEDRKKQGREPAGR